MAPQKAHQGLAPQATGVRKVSYQSHGSRNAPYRSHDDRKVVIVNAYESSFRIAVNCKSGRTLYLDSHEEQD